MRILATLILMLATLPSWAATTWPAGTNTPNQTFYGTNTFAVPPRGDGSMWSNINASAFSSGTVPDARLPGLLSQLSTNNGAGLSNVVVTLPPSGGDDTLAIQTALNTASEVNFGSGTFISSNVTALASVRLIGHGSVISFRPDCTGWLLTATNAPITISGLVITGTNESRATASAIGSRNGVLISASPKNSAISGTRIIGFDGIALGVDGPFSPNPPEQAVVIIGSTFTRSGKGIMFGATTSGGEYTRIVGNEISWCSMGIDCDIGNELFSGDIITGNATAIKMGDRGNGGHGVFSACEINHNGVAIVATNMLYGELFDNCQILFGDINITNCPGIIIQNGNISSAFNLSAGTITVNNNTWLSSVPTISRSAGDKSVFKDNKMQGTGVNAGNDLYIDFVNGAAHMEALGSNIIIAATGGNIGVGTTNPIDKVQIVGNLRFTSAPSLLGYSEPTYGPMSITSMTGFSLGRNELIKSISGVTTEDSTYQTLQFGSSGYGAAGLGTVSFFTRPDVGQAVGNLAYQRLLIDNAGHIGIGTTNPANTLSVNGDIGGTSIVITNNATIGGTITLANAPTFMTTNAAPAGYALGVTLPVVWFAITNSGNKYLVPGFTP